MGQVIVNSTQPFLWDAATGFTVLPMRYARGINNTGEVVGELNGRVVLWNGATTVDIVQGEARALNDHGLVVGMSLEPAHFKKSFVWSLSGGITYLEGIMAVDINNEGINEVGHIVGYDGTPGGYLWSPETGTIHIGTLGGDWGGPSGINDRDQVAGSSASPASYRGFFWSASTAIVDLGVPDGDVESYACGINDSGSIVGYSYSQGMSEEHAVRWTPIPEPSSLLALLGGLAGLGGFVTKRKKS
jgi:uncharacterized membrane protein